jgi:anti-sigma-K factor RskA
MDSGTIHELSAAYALDALDPAEEREFEQHLRTCEHCREDVASFEAAAAALAFGVASPEPPPALRGRILQRVQSERAVVVPFKRRRISFGVVSGLAAAAAVVAIGLGIWAVSLSNDLDATREVNRVLADPGARTIELEGADGRLVVSPEGDAALVVRNLDPAPQGQTYQAWVIEGKAAPKPAGLFNGDDRNDLLLLDQDVPANAVVAVTVEPDGGVDAPTTQPIFSAQT